MIERKTGLRYSVSNRMSERFDLVVIGAGPAGCGAALEAASLGIGSILLLEKEHLPREKLCAGGISPWSRNFLKRLGLWSEVERNGYPIDTVRLRTPGGSCLTLAGNRRTVVVARSRLDRILAEAAVRSGVALRQGCPVQGLLKENGRVVGVRSAGKEIRARYTVIANGAGSPFHMMGKPRHRWLACLGRYEGILFHPHTIELVFDRTLYPRYGWLFPESETRVNVGICLNVRAVRGRRIEELFASFLQRRFGGRCAEAVPVCEPRCHPILPSERVEHASLPGTLLAGDAARLVNLFTGEGISYALRSGRLAARAIHRGLRRGWEDRRIAGHYRALLRLSLEPSLRIGGWVCRRGRWLLHLASRAASSPLGARIIYRTLA